MTQPNKMGKSTLVNTKYNKLPPTYNFLSKINVQLNTTPYLRYPTTFTYLITWLNIHKTMQIHLVDKWVPSLCLNGYNNIVRVLSAIIHVLTLIVICNSYSKIIVLRILFNSALTNWYSRIAVLPLALHFNLYRGTDTLGIFLPFQQLLEKIFSFRKGWSYGHL